MDKNKEWALIENMLTGDFNPNHDPGDGRFTSGSGGASSSKMKDPVGYFKRAASMPGLKPVLSQMDKASKDNVSKAVYAAAASPGGKDTTLHFGNKKVKVTAPSKEKHVAKQYGIHWTSSKGTPTMSAHGDASDLATHLLITLKDLGYNGEKITLDHAAADATWALTESMMMGDFNPNHDPENGQFTSGSGGSSPGAESTKPKRLPRGRGHEMIAHSDNFTPEQHSYLQDLEGQAYEFLEQRCEENGEDFMDLWGVSEPYEEDGITYVDAEYNVVTKSGRRVDRASQVPVSPKSKKAAAEETPKAEAKKFPKTVKFDGKEYYKGDEMTGGAYSYVRWDENNNEQYITVQKNGKIERN